MRLLQTAKQRKKSGKKRLRSWRRFTCGAVRSAPGREEKDAARRFDQGAAVRDSGLDHQ